MKNNETLFTESEIKSDIMKAKPFLRTLSQSRAIRHIMAKQGYTVAEHRYGAGMLNRLMDSKGCWSEKSDGMPLPKTASLDERGHWGSGNCASDKAACLELARTFSIWLGSWRNVASRAISNRRHLTSLGLGKVPGISGEYGNDRSGPSCTGLEEAGEKAGFVMDMLLNRKGSTNLLLQSGPQVRKMSYDTVNELVEDDRRLMKKFWKGEQWAFDALVARHLDDAVRYANSILKDRAAAEDVVQEAFIKVYLNPDAFSGEKVFKTWFYIIICNQCRDERRKRGTFRNFKMKFVTLPEAENAAPDEQLHEKEVRAYLVRALQGLPEKYRTVIELCDLQGLSDREAAEITGKSISAVAVHLHRGRRRLKKDLHRKFGLDFEELLYRIRS